MQNKPRKGSDAPWIISSLSLAITLGLWGVFSSDSKKVAGVSADVTIQPPPDQVVVTQSQSVLLPGQTLLFGGTAPQPAQTIVTTTTRTRSKGSGGAAASTGSSKP